MMKFTAPATGTGKVVLAHGLCCLSFVATYALEAAGITMPMMSMAAQQASINPADAGYQLAMLYCALFAAVFASAEIMFLAWVDAKLMEKVQQWFTLYHVLMVAVTVYAALLPGANEFAWVPVSVISSFMLAGVVMKPSVTKVMKTRSKSRSMSQKKK